MPGFIAKPLFCVQVVLFDDEGHFRSWSDHRHAASRSIQKAGQFRQAGTTEDRVDCGSLGRFEAQYWIRPGRFVMPFIVEQYKPELQTKGLRIKPGITGLWQLSGRPRVHSSTEKISNTIFTTSRIGISLWDIAILIHTSIFAMRWDLKRIGKDWSCRKAANTVISRGSVEDLKTKQLRSRSLSRFGN